MIPTAALRLLPLVAALLLAACGSAPTRAPEVDRADKPSVAKNEPAGRAKGGYYLDDGPGGKPPVDLDKLPDAVPRLEPLHRFANRPYVALGRRYTPDTELLPYIARGVASWYGRRYHGEKTSSGEPYDMYAMTAAHPTLPIPSYVRVTSVTNGKSVVVRVNDRGPFLHDRLIDVSYAAGYKLGLLADGSTLVDVERVDPPGSKPAATARPPRAPVEEAPLPVAQGGSGFYLQLGAFGVADNAEGFRERVTRQLAASGETPQVQRIDNLYRVQLGPYRSRAEAEAAGKRLLQTLDTAPMVVSR